MARRDARIPIADSAELRSITRFGEPSGRCIAVDLQPGHAQTCDPVGFDRTLPGEEFLYRQLVAVANFLETDGAAAHRVDHHRLAPGHPAFRVGWRQIDRGGASARQDFASKQLVQPNVVVHDRNIYEETLRKP